MTRRHALGLAAAAIVAAPAVALLDARPAAAAGLETLGIRPRSDWAGNLAPTGTLHREADDDVRFLLVHHSVTANDYPEDAVPTLLRGFYDAHTGPKGWPDVAYNFFVDRFGGIWEGRAGSMAGPMIGDATGGNQGFSQLCCLIGDFTAQPPSDAAVTATAQLLAVLAERYRIDTSAAARAEFVSRGSNRWSRGARVSTPTVAGHRDMSRTECPGDACYALIRGPLLDDVNRRRSSPPPLAPAAAGTTSTMPMPTAVTTAQAAPDNTAPENDGRNVGFGVALGAAAIAAGAASVWTGRRRRISLAEPTKPTLGVPGDADPTSRLYPPGHERQPGPGRADR